MNRPVRAMAMAAALILGSAGGWPAMPQALAQTSPPAAPPAPETAKPEAARPDAAKPEAANPEAARPAEPFGEELTLKERTIVYLKGSGTWDNAFEAIVDAFKSIYAFVDKQGLRRDGHVMAIYTQADDTGFQFHAAVPIAEQPKDKPSGDVEVGLSPGGRAYRFVHRGSYDSMEATYEAITNFLDEKQIEAKDLFVEEYETDPVTTPDDKMVITVYVPVK